MLDTVIILKTAYSYNAFKEHCSKHVVLNTIQTFIKKNQETTKQKN
jgi:hypothetical protein